MAQKNLVSRSNRVIRLAGSGAMPRRVPGDCRGQFCGFPHLSTEIALASRPKQHLPEPPRPTHSKSATPGRPRPSPSPAGRRWNGAGTAGDGGGTAERDRKSAAASGGSPEAPAGTLHTKIRARPTQPRAFRSRAAGLAHLRPTGTQSDARGRARGRWAGGRLGSRSSGQPGRVCRRPAVVRERGQARARGRAVTGRCAAR